jgi:hypothetical protein
MKINTWRRKEAEKTDGGSVSIGRPNHAAQV